MKHLLSVACLCLISVIASCSGDNGSTMSNSILPPINNNSNTITIDNAGTLPILENSPSSSVIYVHNNSKNNISGISYSLTDNNQSSLNENSSLSNFLKLLGLDKSLNIHPSSIAKLNQSSVSECNIINPGQSCAIAFTTSMPNSDDFKGSLIITASYIMDNKQQTFSQIINYATVLNNINNGAIIMSGLETKSTLGMPSYGVVYMYGSGKAQIYTISTLSSNNKGCSVIQGNLTGLDLASNSIQAIEVEFTPMFNPTANMLAMLSVNSILKNRNDSYNSTVPLQSGIMPVNNSPILRFGNAPVLNTNISSSGQIILQNYGNASASNISINYPTNIIPVLAKTTCGAVLNVNSTCIIAYQIESKSIAGGTATLSATYSTGGVPPTVTTTASLSWYSVGGPLVGVMTNNAIYNATIPTTESVTLVGIGVIPVTIATLGVSATILPTSNITSTTIVTDGCSGQILYKGTVCTYTYSINSTNVDSGQINTSFLGSFFSNGATIPYSRSNYISYIADQYMPVITITPNSWQMTVLGNNSATSVQLVSILNVGVAPATITANSVSRLTGLGTLTAQGTCVGTLLPSATCSGVIPNSLAVVLGPNTSSIESLGTGGYNVVYYGGTISSDAPTTISANITTDVSPNTQSLAINSLPVAAQSSSGDGQTFASSFIYLGANVSVKTITVNYTNTGTNTIQIAGIIDTNNPYAWQLDTTNSTCYNGSGTLTSLIVNGTCKLVYTNVLYVNFLGLGNIGSSYQMNLTVPTIVYEDLTTGMQFLQQADIITGSGNYTIYAQSQQASVVNSISQLGGAGSNVIVTNELTNSTGYTSFVFTTQLENYFTGTPTLTNCTQSATSGVTTQICTLTPSLTTGSVAYPLASGMTGLILDASFNLTNVLPNSAIVSFAPTFLQYTIK